MKKYVLQDPSAMVSQQKWRLQTFSALKRTLTNVKLSKSSPVGIFPEQLAWGIFTEQTFLLVNKTKVEVTPHSTPNSHLA